VNRRGGDKGRAIESLNRWAGGSDDGFSSQSHEWGARMRCWWECQAGKGRLMISSLAQTLPPFRLRDSVHAGILCLRISRGRKSSIRTQSTGESSLVFEGPDFANRCWPMLKLIELRPRRQAAIWRRCRRGKSPSAAVDYTLPNPFVLARRSGGAGGEVSAAGSAAGSVMYGAGGLSVGSRRRAIMKRWRRGWRRKA